MPYTLDDFVTEARATLQAENNANGREKVRQLVEKLLQNEDFVAEHFAADAPVGRHTIHEEPNQGFIVLAHIPEKASKSPSEMQTGDRVTLPGVATIIRRFPK